MSSEAVLQIIVDFGQMPDVLIRDASAIAEVRVAAGQLTPQLPQGRSKAV